MTTQPLGCKMSCRRGRREIVAGGVTKLHVVQGTAALTRTAMSIPDYTSMLAVQGHCAVLPPDS